MRNTNIKQKLTPFKTPYDRDVPSMFKANSLKNGKDVSAFFQDIPVRLFNCEVL